MPADISRNTYIIKACTAGINHTSVFMYPNNSVLLMQDMFFANVNWCLESNKNVTKLQKV